MLDNFQRRKGLASRQEQNLKDAMIGLVPGRPLLATKQMLLLRASNTLDNEAVALKQLTQFICVRSNGVRGIIPGTLQRGSFARV